MYFLLINLCKRQERFDSMKILFSKNELSLQLDEKYNYFDKSNISLLCYILFSNNIFYIWVVITLFGNLAEI